MYYTPSYRNDLLICFSEILSTAYKDIKLIYFL
ncbi:hypothetical protein C7379_1088 [Hallella colorans]|uniref:Uncharacterized protein n=1 Tax=Hallella colorans TaxID=1703337 RepID=A0A2U0UAU0_9BACT|nr:hypothetical protein C7379_1088 [Hallella colorans]